MCHCLECQRRTGAVISNQARFRREQVTFDGKATLWTRTAESGNALTFHFCPTCGSTVYWEGEGFPGYVAVGIGSFADPNLTTLQQRISLYHAEGCIVHHGKFWLPMSALCQKRTFRAAREDGHPRAYYLVGAENTAIRYSALHEALRSCADCAIVKSCAVGRKALTAFAIYMAGIG
jgi:hypothetical protein